MISASCSLSIPAFTSASMPWSLNICTAAADRESEIRTRGAICLLPRCAVTLRCERSEPRRAAASKSKKRSISGAVKIGGRSAFEGRPWRPPQDHWASHGEDSRGPEQPRVRRGGGPVEPQRQRLHIITFNGRATPNAQTGRCVAIGIDVIGHAFILQCGAQAFHKRRLRLGRQLADRGIDYFQ